VSSVLSHLFRLLIARVGLLFVSGDTREVEILALRHHILVLRRQLALRDERWGGVSGGLVL
jgi:hypothetical protein